MRSFRTFLRESAQVKDISTWRKEGYALGSNEGAVHHDEAGIKHYVKFMPEAQAREEVTAAAIYDKIGANTDKPFLIHKAGRVGVAKKWVDGIKPWTHEEAAGAANHPDHIEHQLADHFHAAVLTRNWDATGVDGTNLQHQNHQSLITIDHGGAFTHRAQGALKPGGFTSDVNELDSLRNRSLNPEGNRAFSNVKIGALHASAVRVASVPQEEFHAIFKAHGTEHLWPAFQNRLDGLQAHYRQ